MNALLVLTLFLLIPSRSISQNDSSLIWPRPPDPARIRFVQTISTLESFKPESGGLFSKITRFLFGEEHPSTWLVQPVGIAVAPDAVLYVSDPGAHGVHVIDLAKKEYGLLSRTGDGTFRSPIGIAVAPDGTIYISDSERGDIAVLNKDRDLQYTISDSLRRPTGMAIFSGKLYVADPGRQKIVMFGLNGKYLGDVGRRGIADGEFNYPIAVAAAGVLCVVDALNYRIEEFDSGGNFLSKFGRQGNAAGSLASPKAVALDSDGNLYVTDALMDNLQIFDKAGQLLLVVGQHGDRDGEFMSPGGVTIDGKDQIYVVDMLNKRIQIFQYLK